MLRTTGLPLYRCTRSDISKIGSFDPILTPAGAIGRDSVSKSRIPLDFSRDYGYIFCYQEVCAFCLKFVVFVNKNLSGV